DDDDDAAVGRLERVVPVATDVDVDLGGPVRGCNLDAGDEGQPVGNDGRLQQLHDAVLGLEPLSARLPQPGALERGRAAPSEVDRELHVIRSKALLALVTDGEHRQTTTRDAERNEKA